MPSSAGRKTKFCFLPHECGVPLDVGTPHSCGSEGFCLTPFERKFRSLVLEISGLSATLCSCRFMSFIATNARRTAKFWCVQRTGKAQNAHIVGRRSFPRNCPSLHPRPAALMKARPARANRVHAACAAPGGHIRTRCDAGISSPKGMSALQIQVAHQAIDAFFERLAARDLNPVNSPRGYSGVDEIV
jgi:hypothetical protein